MCATCLIPQKPALGGGYRQVGAAVAILSFEPAAESSTATELNHQLLTAAAAAILWAHVAVIAFNIFGLIVIPLGAWRAWGFARVFWWRALHLGALALVALQAVLGQACFLTIWESDLLTRAGEAAA